MNDINKQLDNQIKFPIYIKENIIFSKNNYNANYEISNETMQKMLNTFISKKNINTKFVRKQNYKYKYYDNPKVDHVNKKIFNMIQQKMIKDINNYIEIYERKKETNINSSRKRVFKIINNTILDYRENKEYIRIFFLLNIYRHKKYTGFQLYSLCFFEKNTNNIYFKLLKIYGNIESQDIYILPGYKFDNDLENNSYSPYTSIENNVQNSEIQRILPSLKQKNDILKEIKEKRILDLFDYSFQCYGSIGEDYYNCVSNLDILNQYKKPGIWDRPCLSNNDCPFYKANKNYENDRGGCLNGICEMPFNVETLTYRHYNKLTKPVCYNCKTISNLCCDSQMKTNSKLLSPDYTFKGDKIERYNQRQQLEEKGLKWYTT